MSYRLINFYERHPVYRIISKKKNSVNRMKHRCYYCWATCRQRRWVQNRANLRLNFEGNCGLTQSNKHQKSRYWHDISILIAVSELQHSFVLTLWTSKGNWTWNRLSTGVLCGTISGSPRFISLSSYWMSTSFLNSLSFL